MKRNILYSLLGILLVILVGSLVIFYFSKNKEDKELTTIKVAEVTHSIFYTPFYVAMEKGY